MRGSAAALLVGLSALWCMGDMKTRAADTDAAVTFAAPYTSAYHVDPRWPYLLSNAQGGHLFVFNKTAWQYFSCQHPADVLRRARAEGMTTLRVALEGRLFFSTLHMDAWPWAGTREQPDYKHFNPAYWDEVERRVRLAGAAGLGLDVVLYSTLKPDADAIDTQRPYWQETLGRLAKYANIVTWEVANEYLKNEAFQDAAGAYLATRDPYHRPVCTSDGTTDDAAWPHKAWVGLAVNHTCTGSRSLRDWYLGIARNIRAYGKPAFVNESGREKRHGNDDGVDRRKQGWLMNAAGVWWTFHTWDGCEGIDDTSYRAPGAEFQKPLATFYAGLPWETLSPNATCVVAPEDLVSATLADVSRTRVVCYVCTEQTGRRVDGAVLKLRLPSGQYGVRYVHPADLSAAGAGSVKAEHVGRQVDLALPEFADDLLIEITRTGTGREQLVPGTQ